MEHPLTPARMQRVAAWVSSLLFLSATLVAASGWYWLFAGGHWFQFGIHSARLFVVLGIYALSGSPVALKRPGSTANACVILITIISASIAMQNPEVEVRYGAILGAPHKTVQLFFGWLQQSVPTAEFDAIVAATSKVFNSTSISDGPLFTISCVAQELQHASSAIDSRCDEHEGFAFNLIIGHAFLLSTAISSGLSCRCCMASWLLSQFSSMFLLVVHSAPSLTLHCYSVAGFMLLSFVLCLSVSLWTERQAKMREIDCIGVPSRYTKSSMAWQALSSGGSECLMSYSTLEETGSDSMDPDLIGRFSERVISSGTPAVTPEEVQTMKESEYQGRNLIKIECCSGTQSTCTPEHGVLVRDDGGGFKEVKAADLVIGATALIYHASEETIKAVTVEPASGGVASMGLEYKNSFLFGANLMNDKAIARHPGLENIWGTPPDASHEIFSFSSSTASSSSQEGTLFKLGPRLEQELALSDVSLIPKGEGGQLYSRGSQHHPHNCTPCWFLDRPKGCADGVLCTQCHYPHPERPKSSKKRTAYRKRNMLPPVQETCEEPAIHWTVKNTFVEWVLQEPDENLSVGPSLCRTQSAPSLM